MNLRTESAGSSVLRSYRWIEEMSSPAPRQNARLWRAEAARFVQVPNKTNPKAPAQKMGSFCRSASTSPARFSATYACNRPEFGFVSSKSAGLEIGFVPQKTRSGNLLLNRNTPDAAGKDFLLPGNGYKINLRDLIICNWRGTEDKRMTTVATLNEDRIAYLERLVAQGRTGLPVPT